MYDWDAGVALTAFLEHLEYLEHLAPKSEKTVENSNPMATATRRALGVSYFNKPQSNTVSASSQSAHTVSKPSGVINESVTL